MKEVRLGKRKVCAINYSRSITLPRVWLENNGIESNDYVELSMKPDGSLLITPSKERKEDAEEVQ
jgi:antitoxin component of MazEF toxin-antitoxin module